MKNYQLLGLDENLRKKGPLSRVEYLTALERNVSQEPTPYLAPSSIANRGGTIRTNLGGIFELRDSTGGTILLTADPATGTVTIAGPIQANVTLNLGTVNNTTLTGQGTFSGTINNTRLINNGTYNNAVLGTPAITGGTYNTATLGTPAITGGTATSFTFSNNINVAVGSNKSAGKGTLTGGSVTISTTAVTANSLFFLTDLSAGLVNLGFLAVGAVSAGTSFNVHSSNALDVGTFCWILIN